MKREDFKYIDNAACIKVGNMIEEIAGDMKQAAISRLDVIFLHISHITIEKKINGLDVSHVEIVWNVVDVDDEERIINVVYYENGEKKKEDIQNFESAFVIKLAMNIYNSWQTMVDNGFLEKKPSRYEKLHNYEK